MRNKKTRVYSWTAFCRRVETQKKTRVWEDSSICPETSTKNAVQEFHLWSLNTTSNSDGSQAAESVGFYIHLV